MVGYCGGETKFPTYESVCKGDGHTEAIQIEWDSQKTNYEQILRVFLRNYRGGGLFFMPWYTQYKSAIWWHDEEQQRRATALKRRITIIWLIMMAVIALACGVFIAIGSSSEYRYWCLLAIPCVACVFPGQLHVMPSCLWHNAESYHQKYLEKQQGVCTTSCRS